MVILDLEVCSNRVLGGPGAFWRLLPEVGIWKVLNFSKFDLKRTLVISNPAWLSKPEDRFVLSYRSCV